MIESATIPVITEAAKVFVHAVSTDLFHALVIPVAIVSIFFYVFGVIGILQRGKTYTGKTLKNFPKITIQIPTFNELVAIRCAESCVNMDYPKNKYEIIIGDDSSDKKVSDIQPPAVKDKTKEGEQDKEFIVRLRLSGKSCMPG